MAQLSETAITLAGVDVTTLTAANAGGDTFATTGKQYLMIVNGDASSHTVTVTDHGSVAPVAAKQFNADVDVVVAAGKTVIAGPWPATRFQNSGTGLVDLSYDAVTSLTIGLLRTA